jgi:alkyldihydroxyacetonephosphate synthase
MPYLRDYVMDHAVMCDVSETSATWTNLLPMYYATIAAIKKRFAEEQGGFGYVGCHMSHTYETGACLYFTYAAKQIPGKEISQYYGYKQLVTNTFMQTGASLTHHHAVGYEHMPWMAEEISPAGLETLRALKTHLDPKGILNPGKLIPAVESKEVPATEPSWWVKAPSYVSPYSSGLKSHAIDAPH